MAIDITLKDITSGFISAASINSNNTAIEAAFDKALNRTSNSGSNEMEVDLDMGLNKIFNVVTDANDSSSLLTVGAADDRYVTEADIALVGELQDAIDAEEAARVSADNNLQAQISGAEPLEASAFSEISWHDQEVSNSVTIPDNKNAWSFGPVMSIAAGQTVTIGSGSFWTIANGEQQ